MKSSDRLAPTMAANNSNLGILDQTYSCLGLKHTQTTATKFNHLGIKYRSVAGHENPMWVKQLVCHRRCIEKMLTSIFLALVITATIWDAALKNQIPDTFTVFMASISELSCASSSFLTQHSRIWFHILLKKDRRSQVNAPNNTKFNDSISPTECYHFSLEALDLVPDIVRSIGASKVLALRQQTQVLWERYFSSIEKIVFTTLEVSRLSGDNDRIATQTTLDQGDEIGWSAMMRLNNMSQCIGHIHLSGGNFSCDLIVQGSHQITKPVADYSRLVGLPLIAPQVDLLLEIIRERLPKEPSRDSLVWNTGPGALLTLPHFSDTWQHYPFYQNMLGNKPGEQFTAIIYSQLGSSTMNTAPLFRLVRNVAHSQYVARFLKEAKLPKTKPVETLKRAACDPFLKCKVAFCKTIADECQPFLQRFQTSKPMTPYLFEAVEKLLDTL
uniref:Uncharacterized protein n=1 Tax=Timema douglasi TaxID=61478 RepID=A0A7R8VLD2_TIMDO|nr:unnamed protein product [Timema douglasi]